MKKNKNLIKTTSIIAVVVIVITLIYFAASNSNKSTTPEETSGVNTSETTSVVEEVENVVEETTEDNTPVVETTTKRAINNKEVSVHLDDDRISALCGENDDLSSSEDRLSNEKAKADALADAEAEKIMPKETKEQDEGLVTDAFVSIKTENPTQTHKAGKYGNNSTNSTTTTTVVENENNVLVED